MPPYDVWDVLDAHDALDQLRADVLQTLAACTGTVIISLLMLIVHVPLSLAFVYAGLVILACVVAFVQVALYRAEVSRLRGFVAGFTGHPEAHHV